MEPGDQVGYSLSAFPAISPETSMRFGFSQNFVADSSVRGDRVKGSNFSSASFNLGVSVLLGARTLLDVSGSIGANDEAPDYGLRVSLPIQFKPAAASVRARPRRLGGGAQARHQKGHLRAVGDPQPLHDLPHQHLHRRLGQLELLGDKPVRLALPEQFEHGQMAWAEAGQQRAGPVKCGPIERMVGGGGILLNCASSGSAGTNVPPAATKCRAMVTTRNSRLIGT